MVYNAKYDLAYKLILDILSQQEILIANFTKLYDNEGNLIKEKAAKFDEIYVKYGSKKSLSLRT